MSQWDMANGGDQFGLADRPDSDCMDSPKDNKQAERSYTINSPPSPQKASSQQQQQQQQQQAAACTADQNVNMDD